LLTLQKAGIPASQVDMTFVGLPDMNVAFANNRLDFGASGEPLITIGEQTGQVARWKSMNDVFPGMLYSVMLYGPNLLENDRDLATKLMRVYLKGARDFEDAVSKNRDRATIVNMLVGPLRMTPDLFDQLQQKGGMVYIDPDGRGDPTTLKPVIDFWAQSGTISQPVDPTTLVDFSAVDAALKDLGRYQR
jgi:NitT/TauT family transport system substrate-binding protein